MAAVAWGPGCDCYAALGDIGATLRSLNVKTEPFPGEWCRKLQTHRECLMRADLQPPARGAELGQCGVFMELQDVTAEAAPKEC
jgi:hypothetical protein